MSINWMKVMEDAPNEPEPLPNLCLPSTLRPNLRELVSVIGCETSSVQSELVSDCDRGGTLEAGRRGHGRERTGGSRQDSKPCGIWIRVVVRWRPRKEKWRATAGDPYGML